MALAGECGMMRLGLSLKGYWQRPEHALLSMIWWWQRGQMRQKGKTDRLLEFTRFVKYGEDFLIIICGSESSLMGLW